MKSFIQYLNEHEELNEASLGRLVQHFKKGNPIAILTASRGENNASKNNVDNKALRKMLQMAGFGYVQVMGHYTEIHTNDKGERISVDAKDDSSIVFGTPEKEAQLRKLALSLGKKYMQDSILFIDSKGNTALYATRKDSSLCDGDDCPIGTKVSLGAFHPKKLGDVFTKIKGKNFSFDWIGAEPVKPKNPRGMTEAMTFDGFKKILDNDSIDDPVRFWDNQRSYNTDESEYEDL